MGTSWRWPGRSRPCADGSTTLPRPRPAPAIRNGPAGVPCRWRTRSSCGTPASISGSGSSRTAPPKPDPSRDHGIVATAYLFRSASVLAGAAKVLGDAAAAAKYGALAEQVLAAWRMEYLDQNGILGEESQGHHVRALAFGLVPEALAHRTAARLVELIRGNGSRLGTGFLATGLLLPVLADHGYLDVAYELLLSTGTPSWLGMLEAGATTMWEWWDGVTDQGARGSLNHYSKGAVGSFLYTHMAGIRLPEDPAPEETAYRRVTIAPQPGGGITSASAAVVTSQGRISVAWTLGHGQFTLEVDLPDGVRAAVELPDGSSRPVFGGRHHFSCQLVGRAETHLSTVRFGTPALQLDQT
ncbi:alpha-L-rhamnosidase C-terminal domain-containing protein [Arthrobacter sp. ISL-65]|uniref:alpha-L-rhamnosidase-related protein n=1 Tax=Arthrobacter sp. ISL-65 TaxID=2819112 RepID=UPI001BEBB2E5|nr:alpha-L-rhamnosidase C-terminal domain-containing protein [Arthrobacter sp. ISL-65]MBT2551305.1 hypothetical protein [Arthrobacter sp. ISL-65]